MKFTEKSSFSEMDPGSGKGKDDPAIYDEEKRDSLSVVGEEKRDSLSVVGEEEDKTKNSSMASLGSELMTRRNRPSVSLSRPARTCSIHYVNLSVEERTAYEGIKNHLQNFLQNDLSNGHYVSDYPASLSSIMRLRRICDDTKLCFQLTDELEPQLRQKYRLNSKEDRGLECNICYDIKLSDTVMTRCSHLFCTKCILRALQDKPECPICRQHLSRRDLYRALPEPQELHSKVVALTRLLDASRNDNASTKSVIFSQFSQMLVLLEQPLQNAGFSVFRLDSLMTATHTADIMREFAHKGSTTNVLLCSLKVSSMGIDLSAATKVYLYEPWWDPITEEQAVNCVHNAHQKEEVKIVRLIVRNSIECMILKVQHSMKKNPDAFSVSIEGMLGNKHFLQDLLL